MNDDPLSNAVRAVVDFFVFSVSLRASVVNNADPMERRDVAMSTGAGGGGTASQGGIDGEFERS